MRRRQRATSRRFSPTFFDAPGRALQVLAQFERVCADLALAPLRSHVPPELSHIDVAKYREVHFKPYRVIYEVSGRRVASVAAEMERTRIGVRLRGDGRLWS